MKFRILTVALVAMGLAAGAATSMRAQVGASLGVVDVNIVTEKDLAAFPGMTPAIAKALAGKRPFNSPVALNTFLLAQGLTQDQANAFYEKAFVLINLNTATPEEILLVPRAGKRMVREFDEYRPWKTRAQFDKEISKYVGAEATAKLAQYTFIPMDANAAADDALMTIPGMTGALVAKIKQGRPFKTIEDVEVALAPASSPIESRRLSRFFVVVP